MKVGFDSQVLWNLQTGIPRMARNILKELTLYGSEQYIPMTHCPSPFAHYCRHINVSLPESDAAWSGRLLFAPEPVRDFDVFLSFYYPIPRIRSVPAALFINDLIPVRFKETLGSAKTDRLFVGIRNSAEACECILTISQASKQDILDFWSLPAEKIAVIPLAAGEDFKLLDPGDEEGIRQDELTLRRFRITKPYILAAGTISPRKNHRRLLQAYEQLRRKHKLPLQLVLTGELESTYEEFIQQLRNCPYKQDVITTGYAKDAEFAALYRNAAVFAYPSLYEGFGLPILEAMSCGAPVVTSDVSSMPEVGGSCACYCDPASLESLTNALETVLLDEAKQRSLSARGIERAGLFTWACCHGSGRPAKHSAAKGVTEQS